MSDETTTDRLAEIEGQAEPQPVQVREGRWRTRNGKIRHITPTPDGDSRAIRYPWHDARCDQTWLSSGKYHTVHTESPLDLWEYLGPIEPESEPQPVQVREGRWRTRGGEVRNVTPTPDDHELFGPYPWWDANNRHTTWRNDGRYTHERESMFDLLEYLGPIEPQPEPEPEPEPQPVQIREGRWRTRGGEIRNITPTPADYIKAGRCSWHDAYYDETWYPSGRYRLNGEHPLDLVEYLGPSEPEPEPDITTDDVAAEALAGDDDSAVVANPFQEIRELRRKLETTEAALLEQQQQNERLVTHSSQQHMEIAELQAQVRFLKNRELTLGTRLQDEKAVSTKRLEQIQELRSEVSQVHRQWGDSRWRVEELEQKLAEAQPQPVHLQAMIEALTETVAGSNSEIHSLNMEIGGLQQQLETVKAELVRQCENSRLLQIELDAREQVPQAVSDRFEQGWDAGTARAVETIAEWTEPFRTCGSQGLALAVLQNLPHIMRTLTGLTDED